MCPDHAFVRIPSLESGADIYAVVAPTHDMDGSSGLEVHRQPFSRRDGELLVELAGPEDSGCERDEKCDHNWDSVFHGLTIL